MIDEKRLLKELDDWKSGIKCSSFQDELLTMFIEMFRKKVESQPKILLESDECK